MRIVRNNNVRIVNSATSKNPAIKSTMFPHRGIPKYTWTSSDGKTHNQSDHILMLGDGIRGYPMYDLSGEMTVILITI
jgi:hypothetical protein